MAGEQRHHGRMGNDQEQGYPLKRQLPYPYNQDLSRVLRGLKRRNPITRRNKHANDPVTASYLYAAIQLIQRHLGPGAIRRPGAAGDPDTVERPLLGFLSQRAVAAEVKHNPPPFHRVGRVRTLRDRWEPHSRFIADLLRFGLWPWHYPAAHLHEAADAEDEMLHGPDPVRGLHRLCFWALTRMLDTPIFRLGLIAAAEAEGDPVIGEVISGRYRRNSPFWKQFYLEFLHTRGLRLRPGITLDECADLLAAVADGVAIRALADPASPVIDRARRRCLLGTAALAVIAGCVERADSTGGVSLEDAVRDMIGEPAAAVGAKEA
jgi:hypothetical protein